MSQERFSPFQNVRRNLHTMSSAVREVSKDFVAGGGIKTVARRGLKSVSAGIVFGGGVGFVGGELIPAIFWAFSSQTVDAPEYGIPAAVGGALIGGIIGLIDALTYPIREERTGSAAIKLADTRMQGFTRQIDSPRDFRE